jgi:hypothetical protein
VQLAADLLHQREHDLHAKPLAMHAAERLHAAGRDDQLTRRFGCCRGAVLQ